jgi:hypothetical protein
MNTFSSRLLLVRVGRTYCGSSPFSPLSSPSRGVWSRNRNMIVFTLQALRCDLCLNAPTSCRMRGKYVVVFPPASKLRCLPEIASAPLIIRYILVLTHTPFCLLPFLSFPSHRASSIRSPHIRAALNPSMFATPSSNSTLIKRHSSFPKLCRLLSLRSF